MNDIAIDIENVAKLYKLGSVGAGTLAQDLNRWWYSIRGKPDPYSLVGTVNDRSLKNDSKFVWALRDISIKIKKGEVVGIIGKNGAGKSTLLKVLSRVTSPTKGSIKVQGRISSLLEVGTGFHPDLTGRENIYLNAAILGMNRFEVNSKLDEIVSFSGVGNYLDTPVKRYSSGMYVRLAFSVAAHLDPDILIVDEVLAVGDAEFQKKAIGKMREVSNNSGRTVLVVSHNMSSIASMSERSILLKDGMIASDGPTEKVINLYLSSFDAENLNDLNETAIQKLQQETLFEGIRKLKLNSVSVRDVNGFVADKFLSDQSFTIKINFSILEKVKDFRLLVTISNHWGIELLTCSITDEQHLGFSNSAKPGNYSVNLEFPKNIFGQSDFKISVYCAEPQVHHIRLENALKFSIDFVGHNSITKYVSASNPLKPNFKWSLD
ncbi:ABC transporter ATP-binding protein [Leptospira sp. WS92.C1]